MEIVIVPDAAAGGELIASAIAELVTRKPDALVGVATGSTPLPIYTALTAKVAGGLDVTRVRICQLDEYVGLPAGHPESYRSTVIRQVVEPLGLSEGSFIGPDGTAADVAAEAIAYDHALAEAGGVDFQILGIGTDGHIGFNEPCSSLASRTRIKTLTDQTRIDNARFFEDDIEQVPHHVITQGIGTILEARHVVLLATGANKADAVAATVEGPLSALVPASALQLHPHATVVVDEAAAAGLKLADYFRATYAAKPSWQSI
ncbi:glucosamine-6-phosphate deaminase [Kitasatospora sp. NPDC096147]|uniref:glucosamine-6-phosphate deaminase n=1 Tax=Kitasatospora sp. NPDC096147 TaxID=3364093 RepID=UPI003830A2AD